ncbi:PEP-CTERM sorting domain-containing protein [Crateriforma conspicua]|nr:PEP-CTERM sorting domain-containing protein [Crateriforma conspicua]
MLPIARVPFGNLGTTGEVSQNLYELRFGFDGLLDGFGNVKTEFEKPIAAGEYFIGIQSQVSHENFGLAGLAITDSTTGPDYWWHDGNIAPTQVVPGLTTNPNAGITFSVRVTAVPEPSSLALVGFAASAGLFRYRRRKNHS